MQKDKWKGLSMTERWKDPEWREYHSYLMSLRKGRKIKGRSEESKKKTSESVKKWHQNLSPEKIEERRKKLSESVKNAYIENPEIKEKISKRLKERDEKIKQGLITPKPRKPMSEQGRKNLSEAVKRRYANMTTEQKKKSEVHRQKISEGVSKSILEGKGNGYFKSSKRGMHQSPKVGPVYYRSNYELIAFRLLDQDNKVKTYRHDAIRVPYKMDGRQKYFIIDLEITYKDESIKYVEVKPEDFLSDPCNQLKIAAAQNKFGHLFEVWTERELGIADKFAIYGK